MLIIYIYLLLINYSLFNWTSTANILQNGNIYFEGKLFPAFALLTYFIFFLSFYLFFILFSRLARQCDKETGSMISRTTSSYVSSHVITYRHIIIVSYPDEQGTLWYTKPSLMPFGFHGKCSWPPRSVSVQPVKASSPLHLILRHKVYFTLVRFRKSTVKFGYV